MNSSNLPEDDRIALMLLLEYENVRKTKQTGYKAFQQLSEDIIKSSLFKSARTVAKWLIEKGFDIRWIELAWRGYVEYVFKESKTIPQIGQLKNNVLLKRYLSTSQVVEDQIEISKKKLSEIYSKVLHPAIKDDLAIYRALGIADLAYVDPC